MNPHQHRPNATPRQIATDHRATAPTSSGVALKSSDQAREAPASNDKTVLAINPHVADEHIIRGDQLRNLNRPEEALASYDSAAAISPDNALAHDRRGLVLVELGRLTEARSACENAVKYAPGKASFYYNLTKVARLALDDPLAQAMRKLLEEIDSLDWEDQALLHFALAKTFADNADYSRSFRHLLDGNALKRKHTPYDESATFGGFDNMRAIFTSQLIEAHQGVGDPSPGPVFVVGLPRSGSTLIEQLLCSHPKVFGTGENRGFWDAAAECGPLHLSGENSGVQLRQIGASYMRRVGRDAPAAERIVNKRLDNFHLIGLIHLALPNARIIHARRDPVDTCLSCFSTYFVGGNVPFTYDLADLGRYYRAYDSLMAHWNDVLPPNVMIDVHYEELVADIDGQARRMIDHCGLEWDARCLSFHRTERPVRTASAVQVRQPLYQTAVGRWRNYEPFLGPLLAELGSFTRATNRTATKF